MKLTAFSIATSIASFACMASLSISGAGCSVNAGPLPTLVFSDDGGTGGSDANAPAVADAAPAPRTEGDGAAPQPSNLDPALAGTWRTSTMLPDLGREYGSFTMDAVFDASGSLALATNGVYGPTAALPGCTEKLTASGSYAVTGSALTVSAASTGSDLFGKINRSGCTDAAGNVTDGTMTDATRGALFTPLSGAYAISGSGTTLTITGATGTALTFTKQ